MNNDSRVDFHSLLVADWINCRLVTVKGVACMEKIMGLTFVGELARKCDRGN